MYTLHSEQLMDVKSLADLLGSFPPAVGALAQIQHPIPSSAEPKTKKPTSPVYPSESRERSDDDIALTAKEKTAVRTAVEAYRHAVDAGDPSCLERYGFEFALFICFITHLYSMTSLAVCARALHDRKQSTECLARFVQLFETRWDLLIEWYRADSNSEQVWEWTCFAASRGDCDQALEAARYR
jgi:hypothetical protein